MAHQFEEGQRVFCYEPSFKKVRILYDARIVSCVKKRTGPPCYRVTLFDWNQLYKDRPKKITYDHDVYEEFILKSNQRHKRIHTRLLRFAHKHRDDEYELKKSVYRVFRDSIATNKLRQLPPHISDYPLDDTEDEQRVDQHNTDQNEEDYVMEIDLPDELKTILENDCNDVQLHNKISVAENGSSIVNILDSFIRFYANTIFYEKNRLHPKDLFKPELRISLCKEVLEGIRCSFDVTANIILLYNIEQTYHEDIMNNSLQRNTTSSSERPSRRMTRSSVTSEPAESKLDLTSAANQLAGTSSCEATLSKKARLLQTSATSGRSTPVQNPIAEQITRELQDWSLLSEDFSSLNYSLPSTKYGFIHLLRLLVKLPELITKMKISHDRRLFIESILTALICYLTEERERLSNPACTKKIQLDTEN